MAGSPREQRQWGAMASGTGGTGERRWHGVVGRQQCCGITVGKVTLCQLGLVPSIKKRKGKKKIEGKQSIYSSSESFFPLVAFISWALTRGAELA